MARKTHVIGFRLGESRWWVTRTPPSNHREESVGKEAIIRGIMEKWGYLSGEMRIEAQGVEDSKERIKLIGSRKDGQRWERAGLEVYMVSYVKEILKAYYKKIGEISYRQIKNSYNDGKMLAQSIAKSSRGLYPTMRNVKRMVLRETVRKSKVARPRYKRYVREILIERRRQWAIEKARKKEMKRRKR